MAFLSCFALLTVSLAALSNCQMMHSVDRMMEAVAKQEILADQLEEYLLEEEKRLKAISLSITRLRAAGHSKPTTTTELEKEMSHPVRVLRILTGIYIEVETVKDLLESTHISADMNETFDFLPTHKDYIDVVQAVVRLQEVYSDKADFTKAQGDNSKDVLTAHEVFEIGRLCVDEKNLYSALTNFQRAKKMFEEMNNTEKAMESLDFLAYLMHEQGNSDYALNYTYSLLEYYKDKDESTINRLQENVAIYIDSLGGESEAAARVILKNPYQNFPEALYTNYKELCRGEHVQALDEDVQPLQCHLHTNNNHPLLVLSPAKREDLNLKTGLSFFHGVLTDKEISLLQKMAIEHFEDSQLVPDDDIKNDPDIELIDELSYADNRIRSSNTGWVDDEEDSMVLAISRRISAILSLTLDSAESFQVLSYGIGGFYLPHFDWGYGDHPFEGFAGNRIATWIFYLNDIKKGGATVFPDIGATVWPEKGGAAFWRNLHKNGTGDVSTLHAACPVLEGYKWVSNKWFHTVGNELSWPCDTNPDQ
ncbi:prolyl 4-hydroxylase subunit alpha-1-like [Watersipora subatra]|uniref:prolyl 4-hydroxylase subunit alpha-1-like n=1 Tax=Watersipora subatra TaxID=2589382 RepID=UPI00355AEB5E